MSPHEDQSGGDDGRTRLSSSLADDDERVDGSAGHDAARCGPTGRIRENQGIREALVTGTTDITAIHRSAELCFVSRSISQCTDNARRQKAAIQLQNGRPLDLLPLLTSDPYDPESHPGAPRSLDSTSPSETGRPAPPCPPRATFSPGASSRPHRPRRTSMMHLYRSPCMCTCAPSYAPLDAFVAPTSAYEDAREANRIHRGERTPTIGGPRVE